MTILETARELHLSRVLNAPRELVFEAWTDPERIVQWWGPRGFTTHSCTVDLRPGGAWRLCMRRDEDGLEHWLHGVYRELDAPERLVSTWVWEPGPGEFTDWVPGGEPGHETVLTLTLAEQGGKTKLTVHHAVFESAAARDAHEDGWSQALERLAEHLAAI